MISIRERNLHLALAGSYIDLMESIDSKNENMIYYQSITVFVAVLSQNALSCSTISIVGLNSSISSSI